MKVTIRVTMRVTIRVTVRLVDFRWCFGRGCLVCHEHLEVLKESYRVVYRGLKHSHDSSV